MGIEVLVPDIGDFADVPVLEILVKAGDTILAEQSMLVLESDKATIEVPAPQAGLVQKVFVQVGDLVSKGSMILMLEPLETQEPKKEPEKEPKKELKKEPEKEPEKESSSDSMRAKLREPQHSPQTQPAKQSSALVHAGPAVRKLARELGVDLSLVSGSGRKQRILKDDVKAYVKQNLNNKKVTNNEGSFGIPELPIIDFSQFGRVETVALNRISKLSGAHLHRAWLNVPHVTQFDQADISELEAFRKDLASEANKRGIKLTMLAFLLKASVAALKQFPNFNSSLDQSKQNLLIKHYYHIGVAVDTAQGLVVPVIRNVDTKGLFDLAQELADLSQKARDNKLSAQDMQGGTFTISSLGGIGGTNFTPIVNAPEVAILGVSRATMQPVYQADDTFKPRLIMPIAVSYDHRVIDGAQGARFTQYLSFILSDVRRLLL
jgi:pyruvate dehydrogenase E2 component (dihydrolipoamide acetyltransferase)